LAGISTNSSLLIAVVLCVTFCYRYYYYYPCSPVPVSWSVLTCPCTPCALVGSV
jgi:hypothetical protein